MKFSEIWEANSYPVKKDSPAKKIGAPFAVIGIALLMGVLIVVPILPFAIAAGSIAKAVPDAWDAIDDSIESFANITAPQAIILTDVNDNEFARFYAESRIPLAYDQISPHVIDALVATEDASFWKHKGIDDRGIARAAMKTLTSSAREGASTLTMQLVQNLQQVAASYTNDKEAYYRAQADTPIGKLQEMKRALRYEEAFSKEEIITNYLNTVYFGNSFYGVGATAQGLFSKDAKDLTVPEAALIAGLVQNPSGYDPIENPEAAKTRRNLVLERMMKEDYITEKEYEEYTQTDLGINLNPTPVGNSGCAVSPYPYFCEMVKHELLNSEELGKTEESRNLKFYAGGFTVKTSLDTNVYNGLNGAAADFDSPPYQTGIADVEPGTGLIRGIGQSTTFDQTQVIYAMSRLQTGSIFKPITIASAVDNGINPYQTFNVTDGYYSDYFDNPPSGFGNSVYTAGSMSLVDAVRLSNNVFFVKLLEQVGVKSVASTARSMGLTQVPADLTGREGSITLGSYEASPVEMAAAYATFASGGIYCEPHAIISIGDVSVANKCNRVLTGQAAGTVNELLKEPLKPGGTSETLSFSTDVRAKSGSTDNYSVLWLAAYTPKGSVSGWVADPENPNGNPVRDVWVYGEYYDVGHGGDVAGEIVSNGFNKAAIPGGSWPSASSTGDIISFSNNPPSIKGMETEAAIAVLFDNGFTDFTIVSQDNNDEGVIAYDNETRELLVSGSKEINGYRFFLDETTGEMKKVEPKK